MMTTGPSLRALPVDRRNNQPDGAPGVTALRLRYHRRGKHIGHVAGARDRGMRRPWISGRRALRAIAVLAAAGALAFVAGVAYGQLDPLNDRFARGQGGG